MTQFLLLRFEVCVILISEHEVEGNDAGADIFGRVLTAETDFVPADDFMQVPLEKVMDAATAQIFLRGGVLLVGYFTGKGNAAFGRLRPNEPEEL